MANKKGVVPPQFQKRGAIAKVPAPGNMPVKPHTMAQMAKVLPVKLMAAADMPSIKSRHGM
jgi:hypothetical protein